MTDGTETFETQRPALLALAYRMLGELARAEDVVQEAWLRWQRRPDEVGSAKAFLLTTVARLCLDELGSARARREESRSDRLPEPVDLERAGLGRVEMLDRISMAFLVLLQRLTPAERAVLLLHDVFDMTHAEIAARLERSEPACRQLLRRARENVATERRTLRASRDEHRRLLAAFMEASARGDQRALLELLAEDAVLIADAGPGVVRYGRIRNIGRPVVGGVKVAALLASVARQRVGAPLELRERTLNGEPAAVAFEDGRPVSAIVLAVAGGKVRHVYLQVDPERLRHVGPLA
ncbi:RNA polymerase, sigma-24 subunit, ECF subfamily [Anaeromyxobacter dehalogenans 2CP-1]|uniref:RNA polymerase, sigma-24 subunit, ECF subfamily n=1 Tax=Anaeromyxobacter dehalogenans (strain ATCC BAA-258 / DSM 21875 / 2CP-1) TaxID=455488 RepID=B8JA37_ANAD2|nr:sigma-70 family RNA polymerase sigma factor [Anaeromyxobacter dehalogenans]ACL63740.1 RNA polymerase, sigma-24 subunit, ECF subfamily [Anaeromyxobacter dehalogenans 2CP-1]